jgi:hypothetical protein
MRLAAFALLTACTPEWEDPSQMGKVSQPSTGTDATNDGTAGTEEEEEEEEEEEGIYEPPLAIINGPSTSAIDSEITLDGSSSYDPQGFAITSHRWACDDGTEGTEVSLTIVPTALGDIQCSLTVDSETGEEGNADTSIRVRESYSDWTFMVYINADNNLEDAGIEDVNEMETVGSTEDVNILVQLDRSSGYSNADGNWSGARRYRVTQDNDFNHIGSEVLADLGSVDSGDYSTIVDFVAWGEENYPAERYGLVLWDHGWSWYISPEESVLTKGISDDEETGNSISVAEGDLEEMLRDVTEITGQPLEVLGMDACIMQSWEVAHVSVPYANYYVASQDYEGWDGWNYEGSMQDLVADPGMNGAGLGESIAYRFYQTGDLTQSVIDLSMLPELEEELDNVAQHIMDNNESSAYFQTVRRIYSYDGNWGSDHDLSALLEGLGSRAQGDGLRSGAQAASAILTQTIRSNYADGERASGANGLNIYSPRDDSWGVEGLYFQASWADDTLWDDMLGELF